jgi:hypothetical protein
MVQRYNITKAYADLVSELKYVSERVVLDVFIAAFAVRLNQILGHLFVSVLGNEKQGQPIVDCRSVSTLGEEQRQVLRVAIKFDRQLLRCRLEEFRVHWILSVGERRS